MTLGGNAAAMKDRPLDSVQWLRLLRPASTIVFGPLRLVQIVGDECGPEAEFLDEAISTGHTTVTEVSATGVVALVRVIHGGALPLLVVDGEQIVGAKQNRIFNASFVVGAGQCVDLPVSCVERGRWHCRSRSFEPSGTTISAFARAGKLRRLKDSLDNGLGHDGDQQAVWNDVDDYLFRGHTRSPSAAFDDGYRQRRDRAESALSGLEPAAGQVGIAAVCSGELVGLDLFGSPSLYTRGWRQVARGLMVEVYDRQRPPEATEALQMVRSALLAISTCKPTRTPAPGTGETLHATSRGVTFTAITNDAVLYHAVAAATV